MRALLKDMDEWVVERNGAAANRIPHIADGTLVPTEKAGWPTIPGVHFPVPYLKTYRLDFGPEWSKGIVQRAAEGRPDLRRIWFRRWMPNGNSRAGIRLPAIEVPVGHLWRLEFPRSRDRVARSAVRRDGILPSFARTKAERLASGDSRLSIEERYPSRDAYMAKAAMVAASRWSRTASCLPEDEQEPIDQAVALYDWAVARK